MTSPVLITALKSPAVVSSFSTDDWNQLFAQLRVSQTALYFLDFIKRNGLIESTPNKIINYLENERYKVDYQRNQTIYEVNEINEALSLEGIQAIYLKGAAYVLADLPIAKWRNFADIDLLVAKKDIANAEILLKTVGYSSQKTDDYDQKYYREYMHEIPPLQQIERGTVVDLHHNILPTCISTPLNINLLAEDSRQDELGLNSRVFKPEAMFLHSAIHLFQEGEFEKGLRDLLDLSILYQEFTNGDEAFDGKVIELAVNSEQQKPLYFALRFIAKVLHVELSPVATNFVDTFAQQYRYVKLTDFIFTHVLIPHHENCRTVKHSLAKLTAYLRGHLMRMPLRLLIPHLIRKSWVALMKSDLLQKNKKQEIKF
ncbi:MAG: nucleotidyltransferase family protein [Thalassotalea sp.]|nr:nucleotidyltransferase family protein [Thalassotalea sp.]